MQKSPPPGQRQGSFVESDAEVSASIIRSALIDRLEKWAEHELPDLAYRFGLTGDEAYHLWHCVQVALFPEEFGERGSGLVPRDGSLPRVGRRRLRDYAESLVCLFDDVRVSAVARKEKAQATAWAESIALCRD